MSTTDVPEPHASDPPDWGQFSPSEAELHNAQQEAARARREADEARREARDLSKRIEALERAPGAPSEPVPAWRERLERGRDLQDEGLIRQAWQERDEAELAEQLRRQAAEQAEADAAVAERAGWREYEAETARLAASDDPAERDAAAQRLTHNTFVAQAKAKEIQAQVDAQVFEQMDAEAREHGFLPGGRHVDTDPHVAGMRRRLGELERHGADPRDIEQQRMALDARIAELFENPFRLGTTAPGSQTVPGSEAVDAQTLDAQIRDAEQQAQLTGDWSKWDQLQVRATTS